MRDTQRKRHRRTPRTKPRNTQKTAEIQKFQRRQRCEAGDRVSAADFRRVFITASPTEHYSEALESLHCAALRRSAPPRRLFSLCMAFKINVSTVLVLTDVRGRFEGVRCLSVCLPGMLHCVSVLCFSVCVCHWRCQCAVDASALRCAFGADGSVKCCIVVVLFARIRSALPHPNAQMCPQHPVPCSGLLLRGTAGERQPTTGL